MRQLSMDQAVAEIIAAVQDLDDADDIADAYRCVVGNDATVVENGEVVIQVRDEEG